MTAFSGAVRRFTVVTGATPEVRVSGAVWPDGWCVYRRWVGTTGNGIWTTSLAGSVNDISYQFGGFAGYALTYTDPATVNLTSVTPATGAVAGGDAVTLIGTGLLGQNITVTFGGTPVLPANIAVNQAGTFVSVTTPAHSAGVVDVVITTSEGTSTLVGAFTYA